jgi:hypothetical protein
LFALNEFRGGPVAMAGKLLPGEDRGSVSRASAIARRWTTSEGVPVDADSDPVRAADRHRLGDLPLNAFDYSYKTCKRRLEERSRLGLSQRIHKLFWAKLRGVDGVDWSRVLVDCSPVKASLGGQKPGRTPPTADAREVSIAR